MIRSVFATLAASVAISAVSMQGCAASGVGDPCIPEREFDRTFSGFDPAEVNVESKSFQCLTRLCLVNHFQGRVTCPYGEDKTGANLPGPNFGTGSPFQNPPQVDSFGQQVEQCLIPGSTSVSADPVTGDTITGAAGDPNGGYVSPQCIDRLAADTVYCSCRCANADGKTDDGANYCTCPDGFTCSQLISPTGTGNEGLTGAFCIKKATEYTAFNSCQLTCDPNPNLPQQNCAPPPIE
jgi:hypothetical protein